MTADVVPISVHTHADLWTCPECGHANCEHSRPGDRAAVAVAKLSDDELMEKDVGGRPGETSSNDEVSNSAIARQLGVAEATVRRARDAEKVARGLVKVEKPKPFDVITGDEEWYTPPEIIEPARVAMGGIDLDPASNPWAQEWIKAQRFFTAQDDALEQPRWTGRVWMNPPYKRGLIGRFVDRLVTDHQSGHITQAVVITGPYHDTVYGQKLETAANASCRVAGRIKFLKRDGQRESPPFAQVLYGFGVNLERFRCAFQDKGVVWPK